MPPSLDLPALVPYNVLMSDKSWKIFQLGYTLFLAIGFLFLVVPLLFTVFFQDPSDTAPQNQRRPSQVQKTEAGETLTGVIEYTLDASDKEKFVYFDFSNSSVVEVSDPASLEWDLAFRRTTILTNSGATNPKGRGGAAALGAVDFEALAALPEGLEFQTDQIPPRKAQPENPSFARWYQYDFLNHRLTPAATVYAIRTADGRYAKFQMIDYYCGTTPGCYTFRYVYQGKGGGSF